MSYNKGLIDLNFEVVIIIFEIKVIVYLHVGNNTLDLKKALYIRF